MRVFVQIGLVRKIFNTKQKHLPELALVFNDAGGFIIIMCNNQMY